MKDKQKVKLAKVIAYAVVKIFEMVVDLLRE